jgi:hypothetical protein
MANILFIGFSAIQNPKSKIQNSFNDLIRPHQQVRRNRQADLLGRFEIDDELELKRTMSDFKSLQSTSCTPSTSLTGGELAALAYHCFGSMSTSIFLFSTDQSYRRRNN